MKKVFAIFLAALLCLSLPLTVFAAAPAAAPEGESRLKKATASLLQNVTALASDASVEVDGAQSGLTDALLAELNAAGATDADLPETDASQDAAPAAEEPAPLVAEKTYTAKELAREIRKYMFIKVDDPDAVAAMITDDSAFEYAVINGGDGTVYIKVDIEHNPQIFNYEVFRKLVEQLYARQNKEMKTDKFGKIDYVMSYEHIVGELALHAILFAAANEVIAVTNTASKRVLSLYRSTAVANLNVDEARIPTQMITLFGKLIINSFRFNFLKLFGSLK